MKIERKRLTLSWFSFYSLFGAWKIVGIKKIFFTGWGSERVMSAPSTPPPAAAPSPPPRPLPSTNPATRCNV